jgi:phosphate-selective porin
LVVDPAKLLEFTSQTLTVSNGTPKDAAKPETVTAKQPASATVSALQDIYITILSSYADVSLGQFKIPVSWEGYNPSSKVLFPERAAVSREFGDKRDLGIRVTKTFKYFGYSAGVFNGAGQNNLDVNNAKDLTLRLEGYPIEGLVVAGVIYGSVGTSWTQANAKDRFEGDLRYTNGPFLFQGEYIRGHDVSATGAPTNSHGFYAAFAWTFSDMLQPCIRIGYLDPDFTRNVDPNAAGATKGKDEFWHYDAGLNYYLRKNEVKFQLAYGRTQYETLAAINDVTLAAQVAF